MSEAQNRYMNGKADLVTATYGLNNTSSSAWTSWLLQDLVFVALDSERSKIEIRLTSGFTLLDVQVQMNGSPGLCCQSHCILSICH